MKEVFNVTGTSREDNCNQNSRITHLVLDRQFNGYTVHSLENLKNLADNNQLTEAISVLVGEGGAKVLRNPSARHIRQWYALADLYDRAGDLPAARECFARVLMAEPDAYDVRDRLEALGSGRPKKNRKKTAVPVSKKKI